MAGSRRAAGDAPPAAVTQQPEALPAQPAGPGLLVVGRIGKPQGIRGEVTVEVRTDDPDARFADGAVLLTDPPERGPLTVAASRDQNARLIVLFEGVLDRNGAEALRDTLLQVDGATLPPPDDPDEFHDFQLVGLTAELTSGAVLGRVADVLHLPHGDVLVVHRTDGASAEAPGSGSTGDGSAGGAPTGGGPTGDGASAEAPGDSPSDGRPTSRGSAAEVLVPFVKAMVPVVDVAGGRVVIDPPDGLLALSEPAAADQSSAADGGTGASVERSD